MANLNNNPFIHDTGLNEENSLMHLLEAISPVEEDQAIIMLSQKFWINYRPFTSVVLCTQTLHQQWLHTRTCYKNHRSATIMVIKFELKIVDRIGTSVSFWPKKVKCWNFEGDCVPNGSTGKVATWGVLNYSWNMAFSYKMQILFLVIELISFKF